MKADKHLSSQGFSAPQRLRVPFSTFSVLLSLSLLTYLLLALYAHPVADDFCYAAKSRGVSLWDWSYSEWLYWNGRYASNLLMIHGPLSWSDDFLPGYRAVPIVLLALTFLSIWFFLRRITQQALSTGQEMLGALVFLLLYLNLMPDLGEGFYWYTGAVTYQLGSILLVVHLGLLANKPRNGWMFALILLLNIVLAVVIVGMDEVHMLLMVCLHLARTARSLRKRKAVPSSLLLLAIVAGGAALMYFAPGNAVRGGMFADTHLFWRSLGMSALQAVRFVGMWVLSPRLAGLQRTLHRRASPIAGTCFGICAVASTFTMDHGGTALHAGDGKHLPCVLEHRSTRSASHHKRGVLVLHPALVP